MQARLIFHWAQVSDSNTHTPVSGSAPPHHGNRQSPHLPDGFLYLLCVAGKENMHGWMAEVPHSLSIPETLSVFFKKSRLIRCASGETPLCVRSYV